MTQNAHEPIDPSNPPEVPSAPKLHHDRSALFSIVAVILSFAALIVSLFEALAVRAEQKADVWPYLAVSLGFSEDGFSVRAVNKGVGPARIRSYEMRFKGARAESLDALIRETVGEDRAFSYELYRTSNPSPGVMSADEEVTLFAVPWTPVTRDLAQIWAEEFDLTLCYCSIYDDCWISTLVEREPVPTPSCPTQPPNKAAP